MQPPNRFQQVENEYYRLRGQLAVGRITNAQFEAALRDMVIQDTLGHYWVLSAQSGQWHRSEGNSWVPADPYASGAQPVVVPQRPSGLPEQGHSPAPVTPSPPTPAPAQPVQPVYVMPVPVQQAPAAPRAQSSSCGGCLVKGCLVVLALLVLGGVGGFIAFQSGALTLNSLLNVVGMGPARIEVDNFRDDAIQVVIQSVNTSSAGTPAPAFPTTLSLNAFDIKAYSTSSSGRYQVQFRAARTNTALGTCILTIRGGDQYQFVTLPDRIAINRVNNPAKVGADFVVQTSSLCR